MPKSKWIPSLNEILLHLREGSLDVTGRLVDASNATLYANCTVGEKEMPVIYKPVAGERPLWDFPDGNLAQREYAAYLISELGGFHLVPPTILRDGPFGIGMVQQWIDLDESIDLAQFYRTDNPELRKMALFDAIVNNTDRKIGHLLPVSVDRVYGCDHGVTFHEQDKLRTVLWQWADQPLTLIEIEQLGALEDSLKSSSNELLELITENEFNALLARVNRLLAEKTFPTPSDEWPAVPWPPF
jgi:uncharacterized repeat protein (TIGR03843 family)